MKKNYYVLFVMQHKILTWNLWLSFDLYVTVFGNVYNSV